MSYAGENDIRIVLRTADGCEGWSWAGRPGECHWDTEPDAETISADLIEHDEDANVVDSLTITGDEWRALEEKEAVNAILYWTRRGVSLRMAVDAASDECDPDGRDSHFERQIDELVAELARVERAVHAEPFGTQVRINLEGIRLALKPYAGRLL